MLSELRRPGKAALVSDETVAGLYADAVCASLGEAGFAVSRMIVPPGEGSKSLAVASQLYDQLAAANFDRSSLVVALGGGMVGDLAGFVAATWMRGLPFVQVPTTLLANVDASVGGKTAVNHPAGKNMVGAFHQPLGVIIDVDCLGTLSQRDVASGLAESVKHGVIRDEAFFAWHEQQAEAILAHDAATLSELIERNCAIKADVVAADEREEAGIRAHLNFGHTIGHAIEARLGFRLRHGECVAIGMIAAAEMANRRGTFPREDVTRLTRVLEALGLPVRVPDDAALSRDELLTLVRHDKKVHEGSVRFTLPTRMGAVELVNVDEDEIRAGFAAVGV